MIIDGKEVRERTKGKISEKISGKQQGSQKKAAFVIFGDNASSRQFIAMKQKFALSLGIATEVFEYPAEASEEEAVSRIADIAARGFDGIVVQLPLPTGLDTEKILNSIPVELDIDVLGEKSKSLYQSGENAMVPPVARAVFEILDFYAIGLEGKEIAVIGKGRLVGEPVSLMLKSKKLSFHEIDKDTPEALKAGMIASADIIISGAGDPHFVKPEMIKEGVVIVDAGTSEQNGKLVGDFDPACAQKASLFTPVPNGVGPVVLACLFLNLFSK